MKKRKQSPRIFPDKDEIIDGQRKQTFLLQGQDKLFGAWFLPMFIFEENLVAWYNKNLKIYDYLCFCFPHTRKPTKSS